MLHIDLSQKIALITGASQGIGRACAEVMARAGAQLILAARRTAMLEALRQELPNPQHHHILGIDMQKAEATRQALKELIEKKSLTVHIWVNNSGGPPPGAAHQATPEDFRQAFEQHIATPQLILQTLLPGMRQAAYGRIINIISTSVREPIPNLGVSNTIRSAVANWAKTLSRELAVDGITVNNILPGYTDTPRLQQLIERQAQQQNLPAQAVAKHMQAQVPLGRFAQAEEVAYAVSFLASPLAAYINGVHLAVDGGRLHTA